MSQISIKTVCCTCLSTDRKLYQLCRIPDGINLLYMLLTHDPDAYKKGFYRDAASLLVCWECRAIINRIKRLRTQACAAQKYLTSIADGKNDITLETFSKLKVIHNNSEYYVFHSSPNVTENFIDCGPLIKDVKNESDSDTPLAAYCYENDYKHDGIIFDTDNSNKIHLNCDILLKNNVETKESDKLFDNNELLPRTTDKCLENNLFCENSNINTDDINIQPEYSKLQTYKDLKQILSNNSKTDTKIKLKISKKKTKMKYSKYFSINLMSQEEMLKSVENRKADLEDVAFKCETCLIGFKTEKKLSNHYEELHSKKDTYSQCDLCLSYIQDLPTHRQSHYYSYNCVLCTYTSFTHTDILRHIKKDHNELGCEKFKGSKRKRKGLIKDDLKYTCPECDLNFHNKDLRWKHVQKAHRDGFKCSTCDKKFAFKNNLERHERIHLGPLPREQCPTCHKMIRVDLLKAHSRIHAHRETHVCVECDKSFVSRDTYESHLKYAQAHATTDVSKHKCPLCDKRYRSSGELNDHINYLHNKLAQHKCPVCGKGLATKRCIRRHVRRTHEGIKESAKDKICQQCGKSFRGLATKRCIRRHVRRTHEGIKESAKDKICQQCGKAFRDKKSLIEHERVHTGARPLACAHCGRAFRQRAALYAHTRRMHAQNNANSL